MNLFFSKISKLSARRGISRFSSLLHVPRYSVAETLRESPGTSSLDGFESNQASALSVRDLTRRDISPSLPQSPYLWEGTKIISPEFSESRIVRHSYYDPIKEKTLLSVEQMYPRALSCIPVGASHGWVMRTYGNGHNVYLTDVYKPWVSSPRVILLPLLDLEVSFRTHSKAVSLSSDPVQDEDVCVAARFIDSHLSVCRLCDSKWTHIKLPVSLLPVSTLTYSKRDKAFYLTNLESRYLRLLDLSNNKIKCRYLRLRNIPRISDIKKLGKCHLTQHLVESPSGELIFIRCYTECILEQYIDNEVEIYPIKPKQYMVFREDEKRKTFVTRKILEISASSLARVKHSVSQQASIQDLGLTPSITVMVWELVDTLLILLRSVPLLYRGLYMRCFMALTGFHPTDPIA